ncbi:endonuclease III [Coxiella endosymbiont of Amblyomma sculptum]|uniref:endonuclease III n=1 Tax=Coxiella endosymbiont of Amblyomma sculptum TaxID=2487929 RepID=UPI00132F46F1|nr:endonuclease III [Coxiella endosymbiont of Amblyomma sculptum]QHG92264.1 endonuclease III [Coxiella endosymbiont of Amblyomma sculptum]
MNRKKCENIFLRFRAHNNNPTSELVYHSTFELLIAVILSAQSTDTNVNKSTKGLFEKANRPSEILNLGERNLRNCIKSIGLYNAKAKNIIKTCKVLVEKYHSQVPRTREELEALPGVGRKTANIILNSAFGDSTIAVDTHVFRVANRTGLASGQKPLLVENKLMKIISREFLSDTHYWLVLHGRYICTARRAKCSECFISDLCEYPKKTIFPKHKRFPSL